MSEELEGTNQGSDNLDFQAALDALPPSERQALADQMQSHIDGLNSLKNQTIANKAQTIATQNFNNAMDAFEAQNGYKPNRHQVASMYAESRRKAGFRD